MLVVNAKTFYFGGRLREGKKTAVNEPIFLGLFAFSRVMRVCVRDACVC